MAKSLFIEGMDGSGKSSHIVLLKEYLENLGIEVLALREPGGSEYYEAIREHVHFHDYKRPPLSDALTCAGGIAANVQQAQEALDSGKWVISDRAYPSNTVYQVGNGLSMETADRINAIALDGFNYDFKILIDIPVQVAQQRLSEMGKKKDRYESLGEAYFENIRNMYLEIAKKEGYLILNGEDSIETVQANIRNHLGL